LIFRLFGFRATTVGVRRLLVTLLALGALFGVAIPAQSAAPAPPPPYKLTKVASSLFYTESGTFSPDIPKDAILWNTIIGEGWAKEYSNSTLVRVTVTGARGSIALSRTVRLTVRRGRATATGYAWGTVILRRSQQLGVLSRTGKTVSAFWLYDTGCEPLQVTAKLVGQTPSPSLVRVIPFACGE